jgi:hypothetical protein
MNLKNHTSENKKQRVRKWNPVFSACPGYRPSPV